MRTIYICSNIHILYYYYYYLAIARSNVSLCKTYKSHTLVSSKSPDGDLAVITVSDLGAHFVISDLEQRFANYSRHDDWNILFIYLFYLRWWLTLDRSSAICIVYIISATTGTAEINVVSFGMLGLDTIGLHIQLRIWLQYISVLYLSVW